MRTDNFLHTHQSANGNHLALVVAYVEGSNVLRFNPELVIGLDLDLPGTPELVEVIDISRTEIGLQRIEYLAQRNAQFFGLGAVDFSEKLWKVKGERKNTASRGILRNRVND